MVSLKSKIGPLVAGVVLAMATLTAHAQNYPSDPLCFPPGSMEDMQLGAAPECNYYDGGPAPKRGFFFSYEGIYWAMSRGDNAWVGLAPPAFRDVYYVFGTNAPQNGIQTSNVNTTPFTTGFELGERFELGYMKRSHGFMATIFHFQPREDGFYANDANMVIEDEVIPGSMPPHTWLSGYITGNTIGNLPVTFKLMQVGETVRNWNVELLYVRRFRQFPLGGNIELYLGGRYFVFDDTFTVTGWGTTSAGAGPQRYILADSVWETEALNHIIGPEIGGRWTRVRGRWSLVTDVRFTAGFNQQNFHQTGDLGSNLAPPGTATNHLPLSLGPTALEHSDHANEFSPLGELRVELQYQFTRAVKLKVGWNGLWVDGIARASNSVLYKMPDFGLDLSNNRQDVWLTGVTFGVEINR